MRRRLLCCVALFVLAVATASAQQQVTVNWTGVAPDGEEFAVYMPDVNFRIRRELSFGAGVTLKPASFEIAARSWTF